MKYLFKVNNKGTKITFAGVDLEMLFAHCNLELIYKNFLRKMWWSSDFDWTAGAGFANN